MLASLVYLCRISPFLSFLRCNLFRFFGAKIASPVFIDIGFQCYLPQKLTISSHTSLGHHNHVWAFNPVFIGRYVQTAKDLLIISGTHCVDSFRPLSGLPCHVVIEDGCWIGARVTITAGVTIGKGSIIGAGSVVVNSIPPFSIACGNPCKVIKQRVPSSDIISPFGNYQISNLN